jgi:hypothetical protein
MPIRQGIRRLIDSRQIPMKTTARIQNRFVNPQSLKKFSFTSHYISKKMREFLKVRHLETGVCTKASMFFGICTMVLTVSIVSYETSGF